MAVDDIHKNKVHRILAHSYSFYLIAFLLGLFFDFLFPVKLFEAYSVIPLGFIFIILASMLIYWAQMTSLRLEKGHVSKETFCHGPYCYTRSPTHWGLFLLLLGFGFINNAFFIVMFTLISFLITKLVFIKKQEAVLAHKYGAPYLEYQKTVRF